MSQETLEQLSKLNYAKNGSSPTESELELECLQRIANATEAMAVSHVRLQNEREHFRRMYNEQLVYVKSLKNTIKAYKGVITKLKNKKQNGNN